MMGKNWNSKTGEYSDLVGQKTISNAEQSKKMKSQGYSVKEIAEKLGLSSSRIYEYLRE